MRPKRSFARPVDDKARERANRYHDAVNEILLRDWDPIGVADAPTAAGEYSTYAAAVTSLLVRGESKERLIDYLWTSETETMGLDGDRARIESVAERLLQLRHDIDGDTNP